MLKKKKMLSLRSHSMQLNRQIPMWKLPPSQSLEFALQPFHIQNTTSHQEIRTKQQWLNRRSEFTAQTSITALTHDHTYCTTHKFQWFKPKTWMSWATNNAQRDKTALSLCSALKATTWKTPSSSTKHPSNAA